MAVEFGCDLNFSGGGRIINLRLEILAAAPLNPFAGQMYISSTDGNIYKHTGSVWDKVANFSDLATKFDKAGGTVTGDVVVHKSNQQKIRLVSANDANYATEMVNNYDGAEPFYLGIGSQKTLGSKQLITASGVPVSYLNGYYGVAITRGALGNPVESDIVIFVDDNNRVGIGTTTPTEKLDLVGNAKVSGELKLAGTSTQYVDGTGAFQTLPTTLINEITSSGTWTKPVGAKMVEVIVIGAGGGGGSGRKRATGTSGTGGGGGSGGATARQVFLASELTASVLVTIGTKGIGGAAVSADSTNGSTGTAGGFTTFGSYLRANGGSPGTGGTVGTGTGGSISSGGHWIGTAGGASNISGTAGNGTDVVNNANLWSPTGGGAGGGFSAANVAFAGGRGGNRVFGTTDNAGTGGANTGANGVSGTALVGLMKIGLGGGGGGANGGAGANGINGSGGGGGGAGIDATNNSGKGGDGGDGLCVVVTYF
jgi:hypothetical protein